MDNKNIPNPSLKVEEVSEEYIFISNSAEGETGRTFSHPSQMQYFAKMEETIKRVERQQLRDNAVAQGILDNLGISTKNSYTPMALLGMALFNAKIILDGQVVYGIEVDSANDYMKRVIRLDGIITEEPEHPTYMHKVDGVWTFDEEKYNAMLSSL